MLFTTAYYADKRELYVKARKILSKFVCQQMIRDFKAYEISVQFPFIFLKVFGIEWFNNPLIISILWVVHEFIAKTKSFQDFCERQEIY